MGASSRRAHDLTPRERRELLAELLREKATGEAGDAALVPCVGEWFEPFPLSDVQFAYWVGRGGGFELGNVGAHVYLEFELPGVDVGRVGGVWRGLVERHGMLRAVVRGDGLQQVLERVPEYEVRVLDLRGVGGGGVERALLGVREELSHQLLPADRWPLFELRVSLLPGGLMRLHLSVDLLVVDFMSIQVLLRDALALFLGESLPVLELSFRDYVLAERGLRGSGRARRAEGYWRGRVGLLPAAPELPLRVAPGLVERPRFVRRSGRLGVGEWGAVKGWARAGGVTPSAVLLAAFADVLAVWSAEPRFTLNLTLFNRLPLHPQVGLLVGDFTSLTLLEVDARADVSFLERVRRLQGQLWSDLDHREFSGVRVLRELVRESGRAAVMPVVFTSTLSQGLVEAEDAPPEVPVELVYAITQTPQVWLDHQVSEQGGELLFSWDAVEELFPAGLLDGMFEAYCGLLGRLSVEAGRVGAESARGLVAAGDLVARARANATVSELPAGLLHERFVELALAAPDRVALRSREGPVSYGELLRRASVVARGLRARGLRGERLVAVVLGKGPEQAAAVLAVLQAGGAYLPLDPDLPQQRLWQLLEDGEVELVLTSAELAARLRWPAQVRPLALEELDSGELFEPVAVAGDPAALAYVIYTSGSTGRPKGVMIEHRAALNTVVDINRRFAVGAADRVLALSALSFDLSVYDVFGPLSAGASVVYPESEREREPAHWHELLEREQVTIWNSVPALAQLLDEHARRSGRPLPPSLRLLLLSGDWIPLELARSLRAQLPDAQLVSLGGATEAAIWSVYHQIHELDPDWTSVPYGRPLANQQLHVLDHKLEPRPSWVPGDLYIAGAGLARGYWRDPDKTARSFITHPDSGQRLYRTGDLARYHPDGTVEFLGRNDTQIKLHGYRIELGEIEATLTTHPQIETALVTTHDTNHGKQLLAYYIPTPNTNPTPQQLQHHISQTLPTHMHPHHYQPLQQLPLTPNGKIDRNNLPKPNPTPHQHTPPRGRVERELARIWEDELGVAPIGAHDDFFELGGDSVPAIAIRGRIQQSFDFNVSPAALLAGTTVARLATIVRDGNANRRALVELAGPPATRVRRGTPVVFMHPADGRIHHYAELAQQLAGLRPVYAVQPVQLATTIEALAAAYADELRASVREPFVLAGWSFGGAVALEVAQHLSLDEPPPLIVLDGDLPRSSERATNEYLRDAMLTEYEQVFGPDVRDPLSAIGGSASSLRANLVAPPGVDAKLFESVAAPFVANVEAFEAYRPQPYAGRIVLLVAEARPAASKDDCCARWNEVARGGLEVYDVPGDHYAMLRSPQVEVVAARIEDSVAAGKAFSAAP